MKTTVRLILALLATVVVLLLLAGFVQMQKFDRLCTQVPDVCAEFTTAEPLIAIQRLLFGALVGFIIGSAGVLLAAKRPKALFDDEALEEEKGDTPGLMLAKMEYTRLQGQIASERNLLRNVIDSVPDYIYVKDLKSRFVLYNRAMAELLGIERTPGIIVGRTNAEVYDDPDVAAKATDDEQDVITTGIPLGIEESIVDKNDVLRWLRTTKIPWRDRHGNIVGTIGISHDITDRKLLEERLQRRLRETLLLNRVVAAATSSMAIEEVLSITCRELAHALDLPQTAFALMDDDKKNLTVVAEYITVSRPSTLGIQIPIEGNLATQYVLTSRKPLVIPNVPNDDRMGQIGRAMAERGTVSLLIVPLLIRKEVLGTLGLNATVFRNFTEEDVSLVQNVAAAISQSLDSKRLYEVLEKELIERINAEEALRRQNEYLAALHDTALGMMRRLNLNDLLGALVTRAAQLFGTSHGFLYLVSPDGETLERKVNQGIFTQTLELPPLRPGAGLSGKIWQSGQQLMINNYDEWSGRSRYFESGQVKAIMGAPLKSDREVLGVIGIAYGPESGETFEPAEMAILNRFAELATISLDNARLFAAEHAAREQAETLRAATQALSATIDLQEVFNRLLTELHKVVPYDGASIQQIDGDRIRIIGGVGVANLDDLSKISLDLEANRVFKKVIKARHPLILENVVPELGSLEARPVIPSWMGVPLIFGDRLIGMITLDKYEPGFYTPAHAELAAAFAAQAAIAIENARLYTAQQQARQIAETLREANLALTRSFDLEIIYDRLLEYLRGLVPYHSAAIYLVEEDQITVCAVRGHESWSGPEAARPDCFTLEPGSIMHNLIESQDSLCLPNVNDHPGWPQRESLSHIHSWLGVPMVAGGKVVGICALGSIQTNFFTEEHVQLAEALAAQAGFAIQNARLFETERLGRAELALAISEAQEARAAAEAASQAKSTFLANVSHELRTPLTSVMGFAKIIKKRLSNVILPAIPNEEQRIKRAAKQVCKNIDIILAESERLTGLINDVLDLAKIEAGKIEWQMQPLVVQHIIERSVAATLPLFNSKPVELTVDIEKDLPVIIGDPNRLIQVMVNLLSNAAKFTEAGTVTCRARCTGENIEINVVDNGPGIAPEDQAHIFEQFVQVGDTLTDKPQGTGLGLPISKQIVEYHGGQIWAESELNKGSTFTFTLPVVATGLPRTNNE